MAKYNPIQTNFSSGEFSPRIRGRVDLQKYGNGVAKLQNFIPMLQGGIYRRSGTRFVNEVKDSSKRTRLLEFEFSTVQAYAIEAGESYMRFYRDEGQITSSFTVTGATNASPIEITTSAAHGLMTGNTVTITGVTGNTAANGTFIITKTGASTFTLDGSTGNGAYSAGGTGIAIVEISNSPYQEEDLPTLNYVQSADVMYLAHGSYAPRKLSRTSHTAWTLTAPTIMDGPYLDENTTSVTFTASGATGSITITAGAATAVNGGQGFISTDVGRLIRIRNGTAVGYATIDSITSNVVVACTVNSTIPTAGVTTWRMGAWSDTTGWPKVVCFFEQRLCFANTDTQPQTLWMSNSADYENFAPTDTSAAVQDDNAITYTIASTKVNAIRWMDGETVLLVGTTGAEWQLKAASISDPLTPTNVQVTLQRATGSRAIRSIRVGSAVVFVQKSGRKVEEMVYQFENDRFIAKDLSILSEHLPREGDFLEEVCYQQEPDSIYWASRNDGLMIGATYLREQEILAWHRFKVGGSFGDGDSVIESVISIPNPEGTADQLWIIVKRTIDGSTVRYIEFLEDQFLPTSSTDKDSMYFVDCGLTYNGSPTTTISGLDHLEGEEVQVCADGSHRPNATVSGGQITLTSSASIVHVGLPYSSIVTTMPIEGGGDAGTSQGKIKRIHKLSIRVLDSLTLSHGPDEDNLTTLAFRSTNDPMDTSPPLFSEDKLVHLTQGYETDGDYTIIQDKPYPLTITCLIPQLVVHE